MTAWKASACILCECNCGLQVELGGEDGRRLVRLRGDKRHPVSKGYACEKPHRLDHYQHAADRLTTPLKRRADGSFEALSWEQALREIAARLSKVRDEHGGETIFYYGGGGQGNHLPGAYSSATRRVLGSRYRSSALAQEKTGEFWIAHRMMGSMTRADFEHADVALFIGKNPWHSHSIQRARVVLKELSADPERTLIVIDPRRTETAKLADIHLQVKPGTDAWLLSALIATLVQENLVDHEFVAAHASGVDAVLGAFSAIDIGKYAARAGVAEEAVRSAARTIGKAARLSTMEDLGVQMNHHSTLASYLHRLLWMLTGNLGKPGTHYIPTPLIDFTNGELKRKSPVVGAPVIGGLVPCNVIAEEILTDHPKRFRAMIIEAANPVHSLADSQRMREALEALDTVVVIDVAMSETARAADYVLPAATQFEKAEATFFNFEFPANYFHLRRRMMSPPEGPLPEAEIHARLCEALGAYSEADLAPLVEAAKSGLSAYAAAFVQHVLGNSKLSGVASAILYRTLGPALPEDLREGAVLFGLVFAFAMQHSDAMTRAGHAGPAELFQAMLDGETGIVLAVDEWKDVLGRIATPDQKLALALDDMLEEVKKLEAEPAALDDAFPFVLSAGERRSFTANTIIRDPSWRKKDAEGALRVSPADASALGVSTGDRLRLTTKRGSTVVAVEVSDTMQPGHVSLPNGLGTNATDLVGGIAPNELTAVEDRDPFVGTPWHKNVRARLELV
ncbi:MAG: molybdopterin-dependent oxidoreductase [Myxococcales bacterium]|nr:molybdopterin-dependent oxidoreductase [Myxococcales bacterium]MCB9577012.1 molybdopterin-dependent oxidoreductase [Polyangiaceae bacterium]